MSPIVEPGEFVCIGKLLESGLQALLFGEIVKITDAADLYSFLQYLANGLKITFEIPILLTETKRT